MWLQKLDSALRALAYSPDGATLYSLDIGGRLRRWDIATRTGRVLVHSGFVQDAAPNGRAICPLADGQRIVVYAYRIGVVDAEMGDANGYNAYEPPRGFERYEFRQFTADGQLLAVRRDNRAITTWDVVNRHEGPVLREWPAGQGLIDFGRTPDGQTLAILERRRHAAVIDLSSGEVRCRFWPAVERDSNCPLHLSRDGNTLVVNALTHVDVWDVSSSNAKRVAQITSALPNMALAIHSTAPMCAAMNRNRALTLFSLQSGEPIRSFDLKLGKEVMCVCFSPDGHTCAAGGSNGRFAVFDVDV